MIFPPPIIIQCGHITPLSSLHAPTLFSTISSGRIAANDIIWQYGYTWSVVWYMLLLLSWLPARPHWTFKLLSPRNKIFALVAKYQKPKKRWTTFALVSSPLITQWYMVMKNRGHTTTTCASSHSHKKGKREYISKREGAIRSLRDVYVFYSFVENVFRLDNFICCLYDTMQNAFWSNAKHAPCRTGCVCVYYCL